MAQAPQPDLLAIDALQAPAHLHHGIANVQGNDRDPDILAEEQHLRKALDRFLDPIRSASRWLGLLVFFLGFHLFLVINLLQYLTTRSPLGYALGITSVDRSGENQEAPHTDRRFSRRNARGSTIGTISAQQPAALRPREQLATHHAASLVTAASGAPRIWAIVRARVSLLARAIRYELRTATRKLEEQGGTPANIVQSLGLSQRRQRARPATMVRAPSHLPGQPWRFDALPVEIINHVLLLAASPASPDSIPCTISLLSRYMHSLVNARLYRTVRLDTPRKFRLFRLTVALHRPALGELVKKLQVGSSVFDEAGYLPEQVAEQISLAVGLEQILLSCVRLEDLSVDLFGLAALHGGTASLIETGAMPKRLCTELSIPDYLSLPLFYDLRHLDLIAFGLDIRSARQLREQLPLLQSLTLRYVTRGFNSLAASGAGDGAYSALDDGDKATSVPWHQDVSLTSLCNVEEARARRGDFEAFAQTVQYLRLWPEDARDGQQLKALTVLAWPTALWEISKRLEDRDVLRVHQSDARAEWDWSEDRPVAKEQEEVDEGKVAGAASAKGRRGRAEGAEGVQRGTHLGGARGLRNNGGRRAVSPSASSSAREALPSIMRTHLRRAIVPPSNGSTSPLGTGLTSDAGEGTILVTPTPMRLGLDPAYARGPRRGASEEWWREKRAEMIE